MTSASVAYADPPPKVVRVDPPAKARAEAIAATVVTGLFIGTTFVVHERSQQLGREASDLSLNFAPAVEQQHAIDRTDRWHEATYVLAGVSLISVAVTGYLWSRAQPTYRVDVAPIPNGGATIGFTSSW